MASDGPPTLDGYNVGSTTDLAVPKPLEPPTSSNGTLNSPQDDSASKAVDDVVYSDIGVNTLLNRLKQSIASARDFAGFLKKRSTIEEEHAQGLKKLCRSTHEIIRRQESRQGSYAQNFDEVTSVHERMSESGMQFALSLHQMHEDLTELTNNMERGRKHWKLVGLTAEKKAADAENHMDKAKSKYDSLAEDYDRVRTGDKASGRGFGLRGPKSGAQAEENLHNKLQTADADYQAKVQAAQAQRQELVTSSRPQAVKGLQELISECDSALTLQLSKFAAFNEKLLLSNGMLISPVKGPNEMANGQRSLRDIVAQVDNEKDLQHYLRGHSSKVPARPAELQYIKHPSLAPSQQPAPAPQSSQTQQQPPPMQQLSTPTQQQQPPMQQPQPPPSFASPPVSQNQSPQPDPYTQGYPTPQSPSLSQGPSSFSQGPPQLHYQPSSEPHFSTAQYGPSSQYPTGPAAQMQAPQSSGVTYAGQGSGQSGPVFGVTLEALFERDGQAVHSVVCQCIQAIDLYGLDVEGIYRVPGTASVIQTLKGRFDRDFNSVDLRNPEAFQHDVNSVAGLLKQWIRDLPDPLLTSTHYNEFIDAARIDDDVVRRDSLHAIINGLPDPNYATLRAIIFHLHRVVEHSANNRMSSSNLAICFAPSLMGPHRGAMADAGLQARIIDTILQNTYQIFEED